MILYMSGFIGSIRLVSLALYEWFHWLYMSGFVGSIWVVSLAL